MRITVAQSELRTGYVESRSARQMVDVPVEPGFDAVGVDVFLGIAQGRPLGTDNAFIVADIARGDEGSVLVVARPMNLDSPVRAALAAEIREARAGLKSTGWDGSTLTRMVIFGGDDEGFLRQVEVAVDPD